MSPREEVSDKWQGCEIVLPFISEGVFEDRVTINIMRPELVVMKVDHECSKPSQTVKPRGASQCLLRAAWAQRQSYKLWANNFKAPSSRSNWLPSCAVEVDVLHAAMVQETFDLRWHFDGWYHLGVRSKLRQSAIVNKSLRADVEPEIACAVDSEQLCHCARQFVTICPMHPCLTGANNKLMPAN